MARNQEKINPREFDSKRSNHGRFHDEEYDHYEYRDGFGRSTKNDRDMKFRTRDEYDAYRGIERNYNLGNGTSMRRSSGDLDFMRRTRSYGLGSYHENDAIRNYPNHAYDYGRAMERGDHYGKGPKGWKRSDDRIKEEVCEALNDSSFVDASDIDVSVKEGIVSLSGNVESREVKLEAERCVERVRGVFDVQNGLRVERSQGQSDIRKSGETPGKSEHLS